MYNANAKVWLVARSKDKAQQAIKDIQATTPNSKGQLEYLIADFNDLATIKPAVDDFLKRETKLDVLWNNAGIMIPPQGTVTTQGYEAQLGVNTIAPFLLTHLLTDILLRTAQTSPTNDTRVVWVSSSAAGGFSPKGGVDMDALNVKNKFSQWQNYGVSKAGNILHSSEFARKYGSQGILSVVCPLLPFRIIQRTKESRANPLVKAADPGNLDTALYQNMPKWQHVIAKKLALKPTIFGAYTELFAGLSKDIVVRDGVAWVNPWGKVGVPRDDIVESCKSTAQGGSGVAMRFWDWCEKEVAEYR